MNNNYVKRETKKEDYQQNNDHTKWETKKDGNIKKINKWKAILRNEN
jgi:hypothetical protein